MYVDEEIIQLAKKQVKKKKRFYRHLGVYLIVNIAIILLMIAVGNHPFEVFPLPISWGIGLGIHYLNVFGFPFGPLSREWEQKELNNEIDKLQDRLSLPSQKKDKGEFLDLDERVISKSKQKNRYDESDLV